MKHDWPNRQDEHVWSPWWPNTPRVGMKPATQYRQCIHPTCHAVEYREAPKA